MVMMNTLIVVGSLVWSLYFWEPLTNFTGLDKYPFELQQSGEKYNHVPIVCNRAAVENYIA